MSAQYDYIIVGAGSAGSVLAERLSADSSKQVLLLEEGGKPNWLSYMPKGYGKLLFDANFSHYYPTVLAAKTAPDQVWARGRMLGGSSAINGMVWIRGAPEDFDALETAGNPGWGWSDMVRAYRAIEDHHLGASDFRGADGPVTITTNPHKARLTDAFVAAGVEMGLDVKDDQNGPQQEGVGYAQWNIDRRGRRVSAARAFLDPARSRPNLHVRSGVRVQRVLIENGRALGVAAIENGQPVEYRAAGEVILSAGGLISPKLLMLSGIGDGAKLSALGIEVKHDSPNVGRRMHEHFVMAINFRLKHWQDSDNREYAGGRLLGNVLNYLIAGKGPMSRGAAEAIAFVRAFPGSNRADAQLMFNPYSMDSGGAKLAFESEPGMQIYSYVLRPESEGKLELTSADPNAPLAIDPNYLATERDRATAIAATRTIRRIMSQPAIAGLVVGETEKTAVAQTDEEILGLYARYAASGFHAVGTAAMGPNADDVVDSRLRVRGVDRLRVVDCSVYPQIPSGNTNAPAMALAWRVSEMILEDAAR